MKACIYKQCTLCKEKVCATCLCEHTCIQDHKLELKTVNNWMCNVMQSKYYVMHDTGLFFPNVLLDPGFS